MKLKGFRSRLNSPDFQNQLWTLISMGTVAIFPTVLVFIMTRRIGLAYAGMFTLAHALIDLPVAMTLFNVRIFQNLDVKQEMKFNVYLGHRTVFALLASLIFVIFLFFAEYETLQLIVILLVFSIFMSNVLSDVFMGELQRKGKMRMAGKMQASVFAGALIAAIAVVFVTNSLIATLATAASVVFAGYIAFIIFYRKHFESIRISFDFSAIKKLTLTVFPIFITGFLFTYLFNAQKYYIDAFVSIEAVAIYGFLLIPVGLLNIASTGFFSGAVATKTAEIFASNQEKLFKKRVRIQLLLALGLFVPFITIAYFWGIPLLSWISGVDLSAYKTVFMILSLGAIARAPDYVITPVLIMLKKQKVMLYASISVAVIAGPTMLLLVLNHGMFGAAFSTFVLFLPRTILLYVIYVVAMRKRKGVGET